MARAINESEFFKPLINIMGFGSNKSAGCSYFVSGFISLFQSSIDYSLLRVSVLTMCVQIEPLELSNK